MAPNHIPSLSLFIFLTAALTFFTSATAISASPPTASPPSPPPQPPSQPPQSRSRKSTPSLPPPPPPSASPSPSLLSTPHLSPSPSRPPPSPSAPSRPSSATAQQLSNIVDALIGSGDFGSWVNIITAASPLSLPLSATIFMPQNDAVVPRVVSTADPLVFPYHVVPQRLTFADLQLFKIQSRLPTLLPGKSILVTNNSQSNFTVDDAPVTHPDVYVTATIAIHGVATFLDYTTYGDALSLPNQQQQPLSQQQQQPQSQPLHMSPAPPSTPPKKRPELLPPAGVYIPGLKSAATRPPCPGGRFPIGLIALAFLVLGNRRRD